MSHTFARFALAAVSCTVLAFAVAPASAQTIARKDLSAEAAVTIATVRHGRLQGQGLAGLGRGGRPQRRADRARPRRRHRAAHHG